MGDFSGVCRAKKSKSQVRTDGARSRQGQGYGERMPKYIARKHESHKGGPACKRRSAAPGLEVRKSRRSCLPCASLPRPRSLGLSAVLPRLRLEGFWADTGCWRSELGDHSEHTRCLHITGSQASASTAAIFGAGNKLCRFLMLALRFRFTLVTITNKCQCFVSTTLRDGLPGFKQ